MTSLDLSRKGWKLRLMDSVLRGWAGQVTLKETGLETRGQGLSGRR